METLDKHFRRLTAAAFQAHGFATADLLSHWAAIVGEDYAALCVPERIKWPRAGKEGDANAGVLHVKAAPGRTLDVQYAADTILERINQFMGRRAIIRIKVTPAKMTGLSDETAGKPAYVAVKPDLPAVADPDLKGALDRLAEGVFSEPPKARSPQGKQGHGIDPQH